LIDLQNSFTAANSAKFTTKPILGYPPHLEYVAALPWFADVGACTDNQITTVDELDTSLLTCLHTLELRGNRISTLAGLNIPSLKNLFLVGIAELPSVL